MQDRRYLVSLRKIVSFKIVRTPKFCELSVIAKEEPWVPKKSSQFCMLFRFGMFFQKANVSKRRLDKTCFTHFNLRPCNVSKIFVPCQHNSPTTSAEYSFAALWLPYQQTNCLQRQQNLLAALWLARNDVNGTIMEWEGLSAVIKIPSDVRKILCWQWMSIWVDLIVPFLALTLALCAPSYCTTRTGILCMPKQAQLG